MSNRFAALSVIVVVASVTGCGGGAADDAPEVVPVSGTVTLDGKPLANAKVVFTANDGRAAIGNTNEKGEYNAVFGQTGGALYGPNKVVITVDPVGAHDADGNAVDPPKIANPEHEVVVTGDETVHNFDLKSK